MDKTNTALTTYSNLINSKIMEYVPSMFDSSTAKTILKRGKLTTEEAHILASKKETPEKVLSLIAKNPEFQDYYSIKSALVFNSKTPLTVSKSLLGYLHKRDLLKVISLRDSPYGLKQSVLGFLKNKFPEIPLGERISIARKASRDILKILLYDQNEMVFEAVLWNPKLTEPDLLVLLQKETKKPLLLNILATHSKWKSRYRIKMGLVRNCATPLEISSKIVNDLLLQDLRALLACQKLSSELKEILIKAIKTKSTR